MRGRVLTHTLGVTSDCCVSAEEQGTRGRGLFVPPPLVNGTSSLGACGPRGDPGGEGDREFCEEWGQPITDGDTCKVQG